MYSLGLSLDTNKANQGFVNINKAVRIAARNTLNIVASLTRKNAIKKLHENFIIRNKFSENHINMNLIKDERIGIKNMQSEIGAVELRNNEENYLKRLEEGGIRKPKQGNNLAIPQAAARGGSKQRLVLKADYLKKIQKQMVTGPLRRKIHSQKAQTIARAFVAFREKKFLKYDKSIYSITGFQKSKTSVHFARKQLYYLGKQSTHTNADPWLLPSTKQPSHDAQQIFDSQLKKMLKEKII